MERPETASGAPVPRYRDLAVPDTPTSMIARRRRGKDLHVSQFICSPARLQALLNREPAGKMGSCCGGRAT